MVRVVIADDTESIRRLLRALIDEDPGLEFAGEAENGARAVDLVESVQPDVVVMDAMMPVMDGMAAAQQVKRRWPELVVIGFTSSEELSNEMLAAGADRAFVKGNVEGLIEALREVRASDEEVL